jgi:hypothetical protein
MDKRELADEVLEYANSGNFRDLSQLLAFLRDKLPQEDLRSHFADSAVRDLINSACIRSWARTHG